ncbi:hypothetical protein ACNSOL_01395 [Aliarcobacter lanthieri]|uniref:hypothetical protein n=1 Tax=Aliarcobacter lanthieri TaxID=1355374 RepID=UPI003AAB4FE5
MKYLFLLILSFYVSHGNDSSYGSYCSNEVAMIEYQKQLTSFNNALSDINTNNKLLEQKLADTEKYYTSILKNQEKLTENQLTQFEIALEQRQKEHEHEVSFLFRIFTVVVALFLFIVGLATYFGRKYLIKKIKKQISSNHMQVTAKLVNDLGEKKEFIEIIKAQIYIEKDSFKDEDEDEEHDANEFA